MVNYITSSTLRWMVARRGYQSIIDGSSLIRVFDVDTFAWETMQLEFCLFKLYMTRFSDYIISNLTLQSEV